MFPIINQACFTGANHHQHHKRTFRNGVIGRHCHLSRHSPCPQFHERTHRACPRHRAHLAQASCRRHTPESKRHDGAGREAREPSAESGQARPLCHNRRSPRLRPLRPRRREAPCVSLSHLLALRPRPSCANFAARADVMRRQQGLVPGRGGIPPRRAPASRRVRGASKALCLMAARRGPAGESRPAASRAGLPCLRFRGHRRGAIERRTGPHPAHSTLAESRPCERRDSPTFQGLTPRCQCAVFFRVSAAPMPRASLAGPRASLAGPRASPAGRRASLAGPRALAGRRASSSVPGGVARTKARRVPVGEACSVARRRCWSAATQRHETQPAPPAGHAPEADACRPR